MFGLWRKQQKKIDHLDFIIAGVQKGGTSALHWFFDQHPNITMAHPEEAHMVNHPHRHFFDDEKRFANPPVDHDFLHRGIKFKRDTLVTGSVTPAYTYWRPAMERIYNYHPGIKLIVLLRNPMDRAFSHWNMERDRKHESLDFMEAVAAEPDRIRQALPLQPRATSYVDRGFYAEQMERVFRFFPREQVHVIKFDDFRSKWRETVQGAFRFVGVEPPPKLQNKEQNKITYVRRMTPEERRHLYAMYEKDIERLEQLLGWDCSDWKKV